MNTDAVKESEFYRSKCNLTHYYIIKIIKEISHPHVILNFKTSITAILKTRELSRRSGCIGCNRSQLARHAEENY